jgi:hypothetical protein
MIIADYSGIALSSVFSQKPKDLNAPLLRHMILNALRMYNVKYRNTHGKMILVCDSFSWRKSVFPEYKASRKKNREESDLDWDMIFSIINTVKDEIDQYMPYPVLHVEGAEADDIIATLVETTQEFGCHENVMIVSADKDFIQLQKYKNVEQFSPMTKKIIVEKDPERYIFEHVIRGDSADGVPNVASANDVFVSGSRQTPIKSKNIDEWYKESKTKDMKDVLPSSYYDNYIRNKNVIDLDCIPNEIKEKINEEYKLKVVKGNGKILNYLISNRCNQLIGCVEEFFIK